MNARLLIRKFSTNPVLSRRATRGIPAPTTASLPSKPSVEDTESKVVLADEGRTVVCWHPEPSFPYEYSRPIPENLKNESLLKAMNVEDKFAGLKEEMVREELMKLSYTTKHRWFPRARDKKAKKTPMDRPYL